MKETLNITEPELDTYLAKYTCVFESSMDGLTTKSKQNCANIVIPCTTMKHTYLNTDSMRIFYDTDAKILNADGTVVHLYGHSRSL